MNTEIDDQMLLVSKYYPDEIYAHFAPPQGDEVAVAENPKPKARRRRKKTKNEQSGDVIMRKRKLSDEQVTLLEESFGNEHKLESERKDKLAKELGLDPRQVAVWFQNRRARWKTKKLEEEYSQLKSDHDSNVFEKRRLETELQKIKEKLVEAEGEIQRLSTAEGWDGFSSNSPASSLSMDVMQQETSFLGDFGVETGLENVFYMPQEHNYVNNVGLGWDTLYHM